MTSAPRRDLVADLDDHGRVRSCSPALARFLGWSAPGRVEGRPLDDLTVGSGQRTVVRAAADAARTGMAIGPVDLWLESPEGLAIVGRFWVHPLDGGSYRLEGFDLAELDDHERNTALAAILHERVASGDPLGSLMQGLARIVEWRLPGARCAIGTPDGDLPAFRYNTGLPPALDGLLADTTVVERILSAIRHDAVLVSSPFDALAPEHWAAAHEAGFSGLWAVRIGAADPPGALVVFTADGVAADGSAITMLRHAADVAATATARSLLERDRMHRSLHDQLTGLPNRRFLLRRLSQTLTRTRRDAERTALLMLDLDDFKVANDSLSHEVGDRVLVRVAELLGELQSAGETVGRFGGDEFVVLTSVRSDDEALLRAEHYRRALDTSVAIGGTQVRTAASVGVAVAGPQADADSLLRDADAAMHQAKRAGRNRVVLFDDAIRQDVLHRADTEVALRRGIARRELEVHYQPIVDLETFDVVGAEALVRWRRDGGPLLTPGKFVTVAEDSGLIEQVGDEVVAQAVATAARMQELGWDLVVSLNVSPRQLSRRFVDLVSDELGSAGLDPRFLCLEITESVLAHDGAEAVVADLDALGLAIAIDDFGTGYSSLNHLRRFKIADGLKVDATFVADLEGPDASGQAIVSAVVVLGHTLGMTVTAEGVETIGQLTMLRELGCDRAQGFLISPAVSAGDLTGLLGRVVPPAESS